MYSPIKTSTIGTLIYRAPEQLFAYDENYRQMTEIRTTEDRFDLYAEGIIFMEVLLSSFFF